MTTREEHEEVDRLVMEHKEAKTKLACLEATRARPFSGAAIFMNTS